MATEKDLGALFLAHEPELRAYLTRKLRCPHMAADFTQEIFLRFAELPAANVIDNVRSYLYRTAHNLIIDHFRKEERQQTFSTDHEALLAIPKEATAIDDALAAQQELLRLQTAVQHLPARTQLVFRLNRIEGLTYTEVARRLKISESSVQKHLTKALAHVMKCLET
ncbi:DNA-directed RNA polymerase sigma-70 factor [Nitrospira sp. KM1]|uniref:RNA polymerase sigma factor n=1 Tax=Nitrospira sp. KM1 TaxID=1936990 RepID=UPI0013A77B0E|nr:RNA polymerase sigma factor [Nitrospira sp. KM1]BCA56602.1 DNA-directed RNA polymerase sigma-70 factor [Nitrospira sp. KM1]